MSTVPAWKRLGLQVKDEVENDPLNTTTHLEHDAITNKLAKKLNKKRKREEVKSANKAKKPPKRVKLPKSERAAPPERDQLAYLREYSDEREKWKFSKQKQNWILKNIREIPQSYEKSLVVYVEGLQGGARERLVIDLKKVVEEWNKEAQQIEDKVNAELYGDKSEGEGQEEKEEKKEEPGPLREYAIRCKKLLNSLDEEIELKGVEVEEEKEAENEEEEEKEKEEEKKNEQPEDVEVNNMANEAQREESDNLVIEDIEVEDYQYSTEEGEKIENEQENTKKKEKKDKKEKTEKNEKTEKMEKVKKETKKDRKHKK